MWDQAAGTVFPTIIQHSIFPAAVSIWVQRAIAEQTIKFVRIRSGVAREPLALLVTKELETQLHLLQPQDLQILQPPSNTSSAPHSGQTALVGKVPAATLVSGGVGLLSTFPSAFSFGS